MIDSRQKLKVTNEAIRELLRSGKFPTTDMILAKTKEKMTGEWGVPTATLRPAIYRAKIGGEDSKDIQRTFEEIKDDLSLLFSSIIDASDSMLSTYNLFSSRATAVKKRLHALEQSIDRNLDAIRYGSRYAIYDTFNDSMKVDQLLSTVNIDNEEGAATLPMTKQSTYAYDMSKARVISEKGTAISSIRYILNDDNNVWIVTSDYEVALGLEEINPVKTVKLQPIDAIYIDIATPLTISVEWTNDGYNYYQLIGESLTTSKTFSFPRVEASQIRVRISGGEVGLKRLKLLKTSFAHFGSLYTVPLTVTSPNPDDNTSIISASLRMETELPIGTSIKGYIARGDEDNWIALSDSETMLKSPNINKTYISNVALDERSTSGAALCFYKFTGIPNGYINGTEILTKGEGQIFVEHFSYDWSYHDGSDHIPIPSDYSRPGVYSAYMTPIYYGMTDLISKSGDTTLHDEATPIFMQDSEKTDGAVEIKDWLNIGIRDSSGNKILADKGNYRFTTYIFAPEEVTFYREKFLVYGQGSVEKQVVAPFSVYVNDMNVISSKYMATKRSEMIGTEGFEYRASIRLKKGWNKYQIYLYSPGTSGNSDLTAEGLQGGVYPYSIGFYSSFNPLGLDQGVYKTRCVEGTQRKVSEFELRQMVPIKDNNTWAISKTLSGGPAVLLNYDPTSITTSSNFDGVNNGAKQLLVLECQSYTDIPLNTVRLRFDFSKEENVNATPKLHSYELLLS